MAIGYINIGIVSAGRGESVFGLAAYVCRLNAKSPVDATRYRFAWKADDVVSSEVLLPADAPTAFHNPMAFCAALERAELTRNEEEPTLLRWKVNAQLAKHVILALPKELTGAERRQLARDWAQTQYVAHGAGCVLAIHAPDDADFENHHAHILVGTRKVTSDGLGNKLRELNPAFSRGAGHAKSKLHAEDLPAAWREFQNAWFRAHGIQLKVDPPSAVDAHHLGRARYADDKSLEKDNWAAEAAAQARVREPANLLEEMTRRRATFTQRDLTFHLGRYGITGDEAKEIVDAALALPEAVALFDRETGKPLPLFTTRTVRAQETRIMASAKTLARKKPTARRKSAMKANAEKQAEIKMLSAEQRLALDHATGDTNLIVIRGIAGAGKSHLIGAVREVHKAAGFRVLGLAPTNTVACALADDGFETAATIDLELLRREQDNHRSPGWDSKTCLIIDEAAMVDAGRYERLLVLAAKAGARVILVGDEYQLASVERGGIFDEIKARYGCAELLTVRRQEDGWAKLASQDFAAGRIAEGIAAYARNGCLKWSETVDGAVDTLVAKWVADHTLDPDANRFIYASTNAMVDRLNHEIRRRRWVPLLPVGYSFETTRGPVEILAGDRIQLYGNDRQARLFNGMLGTVTAVDPTHVAFRTDDGKELHFDPRAFKTWALGYAGTVYRGQGKTQSQVYALYDHPLAWHARTSYVGFTRHKKDLALFVPRSLARDEQVLARQMARHDVGGMSIVYADADEAAQIERRIVAGAPASPVPIVAPFSIKNAQGKVTILDPGAAGTDLTVAALARHAPEADVVESYRRLYPLARKAPGGPADEVRKQIEGIVAKRGFSLRTGLPNPRCLDHMLSQDQKAHLLDLPDINRAFPDPTGVYMDVTALLFSPDRYPWSCWRTISRRIRELDDAVIAALMHRVQQIREAVDVGDRLHAACGLAKYILRTAPLIRDKRTQRERLRHERDLDLTPRPLWRSLRLFRLDSGNDLVAPDRRARFHSRPSEKNRALYENGSDLGPQSVMPPMRDKPATGPVLTASEQNERSEMLSGVRAVPTARRDKPTSPSPPGDSNRGMQQHREDNSAPTAKVGQWRRIR